MIITAVILSACITFWVVSVRNWNLKCAAARERFITGDLDTQGARGL